MMRSVCLVAAVLFFASPAMAENACGTPPIAPAVPAASSLAGKTVAEAQAIRHEAFVQIRDYQHRLQSYRSCLVTQKNARKAELAAAQDDAAKRAAQDAIAELDAANDRTVDDETHVVADYQALSAAYCRIANCPPPAAH